MSKRKKPTKAEAAKRKARFKQKTTDKVNYYNKMQKAYYNQMLAKQDIMRRASIVEGILNARPEVAMEVDGKLTLNMDNIYLNQSDNVLYWKNDNNPVLSGLDEFDSFSKYSPAFFNEVLEFISNRRNEMNAKTTSDIDLGDFELIEDETISIENPKTEE